MPRRLALAAILLVCALAGAQAAAAASSDLFFSEYVEGSSNNKALEIYNGTGAPVDLAAGSYNVFMSFNGGTSTLTIPLTGTVADGDVYVLAQSSADPAILAVIPLQLLAYRIARLRGLNVDQPRNQAKTVTVE
jgi:predicted extracellular nuclease